MADISIIIDSGKSKKLLTKDTYCEGNIIVTAKSDMLDATPIPVDKSIERIYFNLNNTKEKTNELLSQLTFVQTPFLDNPIYPIFAWADPSGNGFTGKYLFVVKNGDSGNYEINFSDDVLNSRFVYLYDSNTSDTHNGWSYCDTIGSSAATGVPAFINLYDAISASTWNGLTIGAENDKIKDILSTTPFMNGYDKGYDEGKTDGIIEGVEAGKQAEHDAFWDVYQQNGSSDYRAFDGVFSGMRFNADNFFPKYDIKPVGNANYLFYAWEKVRHPEVLDLKQRLQDCGVVLDTSGATDISLMFAYGSALYNIPTIDCTGLTTASSNVFANMWAGNTTIEKLIVNDTVTYYNWFRDTTGLIEIRFEGVIGHDIAFAESSKLSTESVQSIIDHLKDLTGKTSQTLTFHADVGAKLTEEQKAAITAKNWQLVY